MSSFPKRFFILISNISSRNLCKDNIFCPKLPQLQGLSKHLNLAEMLTSIRYHSFSYRDWLERLQIRVVVTTAVCSCSYLEPVRLSSIPSGKQLLTKKAVSLCVYERRSTEENNCSNFVSLYLYLTLSRNHTNLLWLVPGYSNDLVFLLIFSFQAMHWSLMLSRYLSIIWPFLSLLNSYISFCILYKYIYSLLSLSYCCSRLSYSRCRVQKEDISIWLAWLNSVLNTVT